MTDDWIRHLPQPRQDAVRHAHALVLAHLPAGYVESCTPGMATWAVPLARYPTTYNGQPLAYLALAGRATGCALYLTGVYLDPAAGARLRAAYAADGRRIDLGKSCLRFKHYEDLLEDAVAREIASLPVDAFIARHEASRAGG